METTGFGGPCPRCGSMNCLIKKGPGSWCTFITCFDCLFGYGENHVQMRDKTGGLTTGADVWANLFRAFNIDTEKEFNTLVEDAQYAHADVESPFEFDDVDEWVLDSCTIDWSTLNRMLEKDDE